MSERKEPLTEEQKQELVRLAKEGVPAKELAVKFDRSVAQIHFVLNKNGVRLVHGNYRLTDEQKDAACKDYQDGSSIAKVAIKYNTTPSNIQELLVRRGIPRRPRNGRTAT